MVIVVAGGSRVLVTVNRSGSLDYGAERGDDDLTGFGGSVVAV